MQMSGHAVQTRHGSMPRLPRGVQLSAATFTLLQNAKPFCHTGVCAGRQLRSPENFTDHLQILHLFKHLQACSLLV